MGLLKSQKYFDKFGHKRPNNGKKYSALLKYFLTLKFFIKISKYLSLYCLSKNKHLYQNIFWPNWYFLYQNTDIFINIIDFLSKNQIFWNISKNIFIHPIFWYISIFLFWNFFELNKFFLILYEMIWKF